MLTQLPPSQPPSGSMTGGVKGKGATTSTSSSAVCAGLPTAAFTTWHMARGAPCPDVNPRFRHAFGNYDGPFVVKPVSGRASLHVQLVEHRADLPEAIARIYEITSDAVLIEKYLPGREFCIAAAGPVTARDGTLVRGDGPFTFAALERVLSPDEKIFTSMDVRPITGARCRAIDPVKQADLLASLHKLARDVFLEFNLGSVIRLDVRADIAGNLYILEANPKPDLKRSGHGATSLICEGLSDYGMSYDDLILSLLADRIDFLFTHRSGTVSHLFDLVQGRSPRAVASRNPPCGASQLRDRLTQANVWPLRHTLVAAARAEAGGRFLAAAATVRSLQVRAGE